ncbi:hypothetical protein BDV95DRAFT_224188 [Massariosphaeria phaeospora]|uniref:Cyanovirin-N domain-containing protein n=1 Tax=Massariosphaeria phaeospora TaxID=100035 RepID=A0A7C8ICQ4_9PLEO|nr:hypothetical protein BDV95DRAFT_224188 [Massariosphaeria phaeospora]
MMKHSSIFSYLTAVFTLPLSHAAPAPVRRADSISSRCTNTVLRQNWFVGDCLTGEDETTRIQSAVFLGNKVANKNATLAFADDQGDFFRSCSDCRLADTSSLSCLCKPAYGEGKWSLTPRSSTINLEEHISVYNGHLLSNLKGAPKPPSQPSPWPVPSSLTYRFGGNVTCPGGDGGPGDYCASQGYFCTSGTEREDLSVSGPWSFEAPVKCYVPFLWFQNIHYQLTDFNLAGEGGWRTFGYDNERCEGEPIEVVEPDSSYVCRRFQKPVKAFTVLPAFNGDPN